MVGEAHGNMDDKCENRICESYAAQSRVKVMVMFQWNFDSALIKER